MRILLIRHTRSKGNLNDAAYLDGDHKVEITPLGWEQSFHTGKSLGLYYRKENTTKWPTVFISPYHRPKEAFSGILYGMGNAIPGKPKIYEDSRLSEKFFGATNHIHHPEGIIDPEFAEQMKILSRYVFEHDPFTTRNLFGDSTKDTVMAIKSFMDGTLKRDIDAGKDDFLFMVHGAVIQAFLMNWAHLPMDSKVDLENPGNGDIISIEGEFGEGWTIRKIHDGEKMKAVNEPVIDHIKPFSVEGLPPVPEEFIPPGFTPLDFDL